MPRTAALALNSPRKHCIHFIRRPQILAGRGQVKTPPCWTVSKHRSPLACRPSRKCQRCRSSTLYLGESFRALAEVLGCCFLLKNVFEKMGRGLFDLSAKRFRVLEEVQVLLFSFQNVFRLEREVISFSSFSKTFFYATFFKSRNVSYDKIRFICVIFLLNGQLLTPLVRVAALADTLP